MFFFGDGLFLREYPPVSKLTFLSENREGLGLIIGNPEIYNYSLQQRYIMFHFPAKLPIIRINEIYVEINWDFYSKIVSFRGHQERIRGNPLFLTNANVYILVTGR